jgi:hypothetical protein
MTREGLPKRIAALTCERGPNLAKVAKLSAAGTPAAGERADVKFWAFVLSELSR